MTTMHDFEIKVSKMSERTDFFSASRGNFGIQFFQYQSGEMTVVVNNHETSPAAFVDAFNHVRESLGKKRAAALSAPLRVVLQDHAGDFKVKILKIPAAASLSMADLTTAFNERADDITFVRVDHPTFIVTYEKNAHTITSYFNLGDEVAGFMRDMAPQGFENAAYPALVQDIFTRSGNRLKALQPA